MKRNIQEKLLEWRINGLEITITPTQRFLVMFLLIFTLTTSLSFIGVHGFQADAKGGGGIGKGVDDFFKQLADSMKKKKETIDKTTGDNKPGSPIDKAKKIYRIGKGAVLLGAAGAATSDLLTGSNFIGHSLGYAVDSVAKALTLIVPEPQTLVYNIELKNGEPALIDDKINKYRLFRYDTVWVHVEAIYYFLSIVFWAGLVIAITYQGVLYIIHAGSVQRRISAMDIMKRAFFTSGAIALMPYVVDWFFELADAFTILFMTSTDPDFFAQGFLAVDVEEPLTNAFIHLVTVFLMMWLFIIYFIRNMAILLLYGGFPIVAFVANFKEDALKQWASEMGANIALQPTHALIFMFVFKLMQGSAITIGDGDVAYSLPMYVIGALICVIPLTDLVRGWFRAETIGLGAGMIQNGLSVIGMSAIMGAGAVLGGSARNLKQAGQQTGSYIPGMDQGQDGGGFAKPTTLGGMITNDLRRVASGVGAVTMGALGGVIGGAGGAKAGAQVGASLGSAAVSIPANFAQKDSVKRAGHQALAWMGEKKALSGLGINSSHHRNMAQAYGSIQEMEENLPKYQQEAAIADAQYKDAKTNFDAVSARFTPVNNAWEKVENAQQSLSQVEAGLIKDKKEGVIAQSQQMMKDHGTTFRALYPEYRNASYNMAQAHTRLNAAQNELQRAQTYQPSAVPLAQQRVQRAQAEFNSAQAQMQQVISSPAYQKMTAAEWKPDSDVHRHMAASMEVELATNSFTDAETKYGSFGHLSNEFTAAHQNLQVADSQRRDAFDQLSVNNPQMARSMMDMGSFEVFDRDPVVVRELRDATSRRLRAVGGLD